MTDEGNYGSAHHGSPASTFANAFAITAGVLVIERMIGAVYDAAAQPFRRRRAEQVELAYRRNYRAKITEVATEDELLRLDTLWHKVELSYADDAFWSELAYRWYAANPTQYRSQDHARQHGLLCRCDPARGHSCLRGDTGAAAAEMHSRSEGMSAPATAQWFLARPDVIRVGLLALPWAALLLLLLVEVVMITAEGGWSEGAGKFLLWTCVGMTPLAAVSTWVIERRHLPLQEAVERRLAAVASDRATGSSAVRDAVG